MLSCVGRGLCDGLITRPEESYRVSLYVWSEKPRKGPYVPVGNYRNMNAWTNELCWRYVPSSRQSYNMAWEEGVDRWSVLTLILICWVSCSDQSPNERWKDYYDWRDSHLVRRYSTVSVASSGRIYVNAEFQQKRKEALAACKMCIRLGRMWKTTNNLRVKESSGFEAGNSQIRSRSVNYFMYREECTSPVETEENKGKTRSQGNGRASGWDSKWVLDFWASDIDRIATFG
jgi:hypothetical protein